MSKLNYKDITKHTSFRLVEAQDAEFILSLRNNKQKNKHLSPVKNSVESQRNWIIEYKEREHSKQEYYYVINNPEAEDLGVVRLYDFKNNSFCWGSWILKPEAPSYTAIESALLVYEIAFNQIGFSQSHFDVRKENTKVIKFHQRFGASIIKEDQLNYYFIIDKNTYNISKSKYKKFFK